MLFWAISESLLKRFGLLNLKIFFNHGGGMPRLLGYSGAFQKVKFQNFLQSWWRYDYEIEFSNWISHLLWNGNLFQLRIYFIITRMRLAQDSLNANSLTIYLINFNFMIQTCTIHQNAIYKVSGIPKLFRGWGPEIHKEITAPPNFTANSFLSSFCGCGALLARFASNLYVQYISLSSPLVHQSY